MSKSNDIISLYNEYLMPTYKPAMVVSSGTGCKVRTPEGNLCYDFTSGIGVHNVGHCHPAVVKAIQDQAATLGHCSNLFVNAGLKLARRWGHENGGRYEIITMRSSFHGRTLATVAATGQSWCQHGYEPLPVGFAYADFNDIESVKAAVTDKTVAIMLEAVQGEGGVNPATEEFMAGVRAICDEKNLIMICDEVQCGMGRTGKWWGWQNFSVKPDLFTSAKAIADGVPMGALVSNEKFADVFTTGSHASTFGGNPLACAASLAVFKVIEEENLLASATEKGALLAEALNAFAEKYDQILEVRGMGMMIGMVVEGSAAEVVESMRMGGLLACTAGEHVVRFLPPLNLKDSDLEEAVEMIGDSLDAIYGE